MKKLMLRTAKQVLSLQAILTLIGITSVAHAGVLQWADLNDTGAFRLSQDITLTDGTVFHAGERFRMVEETGLPAPGAAMVYQEMVSDQCANPSAQADDPAIIRGVGIALKPGCHVSIWIEAGDFYSSSLFESIEDKE